jgi:nucleoside phosphorylase
MALDWRDTLRTLLKQFEARAARSAGLHHVFVEVPDHERGKMSGPGWFTPVSDSIRLVDGKPQYQKWDCCASHGLPQISPGFREAAADETFSDSDSVRVIRDRSGVARAVGVPMKLRQGYYCGQPSEEVAPFEALADAAATALAASDTLHEHALAAELTDIFRKPRGGVRYVYGEVPSAPDYFIAQGWAAGALQFDNGVLIDMPISETSPDASHWLLLLHRLGWRQITGSALKAKRWAWGNNVEVALEMISEGGVQLPRPFSEQLAGISKESYYSVLGTKDAPLDVNLASVFAIQILLTDLSPNASSPQAANEPPVDYSTEAWRSQSLPPVRTVTHSECIEACSPRVGVLVATEIERQAVLKRMRPPKNRRAVLQVFSGANTSFVGRLGLSDVVLCMGAMGSVGRDAAMAVTAEIIQLWDLTAVIMVGIAFGKDAEKQAIGNVLVSEQVIPYDPMRVGMKGNEDRGIPLMSGPVLLNRFRNVIGWTFKTPTGKQCGFQIGAILSGEKLVDNSEFKQSLFERYPTAIGGEMEGAGVAAAAERKSREWIIVKAICDWGDGTKTGLHQAFAAASAVSLVEHVLNQVGSLSPLI